jgi:hypothetical protein
MNAMPPRICPRYGKPYSEAPAQSREDQDVEIWPSCGTAEALEAAAFAIAKVGFDSPPPKFRGWKNPPY